ncbi:MAG: NAD-dependent epimerase/dehydratase family protein [Mycobacteriales bacterium]
MTRVLVTGAAGFIGRHVVEALLADGDAVTAYDSLAPDLHASGEFPHRDRVTACRVGDVRDGAALADALRDVDVVCHQAAKVGLGVDMSDAPDYTSVNVTGTATLLAAMASAGVRRLVLASSMVVYGEGGYRCARHGTVRPGTRFPTALDAGRYEPPCPQCGAPLTPEPITEDASTDPRNVYATTKLAQEHLAAAWARGCAGSVAAMRYHNVYGPHMPRDTPYAGVASIFRSAFERGEAPRVFEDGKQRRDFVHVRDVAAANLRAIDWTGRTAGVRAFNVGSGTVHTIGEMANALGESCDGPAPIVTGEYRLGDVRHITASSQRAMDELHYRPIVDFLDGVREFSSAPLRD